MKLRGSLKAHNLCPQPFVVMCALLLLVSAANLQAQASLAQNTAPQIKSMAEYNALMGAVSQTDPAAKAQALESFLQQYPDSPGLEFALDHLVIAYLQSGQTDNAARIGARLVRLDPANPRANYAIAASSFARGAQFYNSRDDDRAAQEFQAAIRAYPAFPEAHFYLGMCLLGRASLGSSGQIQIFPGTSEALQIYLALEPNGKHVSDARKALTSLGTQFSSPDADARANEIRAQIAAPHPASQSQQQSSQQAQISEPAANADNDNADAEAQAQEDRRQSRISELRSEIDEKEEEATRLEDSARQLADSSSCSGPGAALCQSIGNLGAAKQQQEANKARNEADRDRRELAELEGQPAPVTHHRDTTYAGALSNVQQQNPSPSIADTANQQAAAIRAIGDTNAARQQQAAQARLAAQQAAQQAKLQQQADSQAAQQAQQTANQNASSAGNNSRGDSGTYLAPISANCIRSFWDPKYYNWLSFENDCGQAINLTWIAKSPNDHFGASNGDIAAGRSANTGWSKDEVNAKGNFALFVCPAGSVAVDGTTRQMVSNPNATYSCKKQ